MAWRSPSTRSWLIVVGVLIIAGVVAYVAGFAVEHAARTQEVETAKARLQSAQTKVASLQSVRQLLTADVWTYRAAVALDQRNFGVANDAMAKVVASLNAVDASAAGVDNGPLAAVKAEAAGVKIAVATDLQSQRAQLTRLADDITALSEKSAA